MVEQVEEKKRERKKTPWLKRTQKMKEGRHSNAARIVSLADESKG